MVSAGGSSDCGFVNACGYGVGKPVCGYSGAALSIEGCAGSRDVTLGGRTPVISREGRSRDVESD